MVQPGNQKIKLVQGQKKKFNFQLEPEIALTQSAVTGFWNLRASTHTFRPQRPKLRRLSGSYEILGRVVCRRRDVEIRRLSGERRSALKSSVHQKHPEPAQPSITGSERQVQSSSQSCSGVLGVCEIHAVTEQRSRLFRVGAGSTVLYQFSLRAASRTYQNIMMAEERATFQGIAYL
jgi:hypothetical protein